jgi:hypothetical protein
MSDLDDITHINIHNYEIPHLPKVVQKFIAENAEMDFYPGGLKRGKKFNKVKEFKRLVKELVRVRKKYKGKESNVECLVYNQLEEIMQRMMLHELRELNLERII